MTLLRFAFDNALDARAMGVRYLARHLRRRPAMVRVPIKDVGRVTLRVGSSDELVLRQVFTERQYELRWLRQWPDIERRYQEILDAGKQPLVIDAGANTGFAALWFAIQFPRAKVVAIEPEPASARLCKVNTDHLDVDVVQMAIGAERGTVSLLTEDRESYAVETVRSRAGDVDICTVSDILERHGCRCELFIVKIDIEGFESDLFASNVEWVKGAKVVIVEPHDYILPGRATSRNFQRVMADQDFDVIIRGENLVYIQRVASGAEDVH